MKRIIVVVALSIVAPARAQISALLSDAARAQELGEYLIDLNLQASGYSEASRVKAELDKLAPEILKDLQWTGQNGYLIQVRAFVDRHNSTRLLSGPLKCGSGGAPMQALAICTDQAGLQQGGVKDTFFFSADKSYLIWATRESAWFGIGGDRIKFGEIPGEYAKVVWSDALRLQASNVVLGELKHHRNREALRNAVDRASQRAQESSERSILAVAHASMVQAQTQLEAIDKQFAIGMATLRNAQEASRQFQMMQGILSLAAAKNSISAMLGPQAETAQLDGLKNSQAVSAWMTSYSDRLSQRVITLEAQSKQQALQVQKRQEFLLKTLQRYQPPPNILY